MKGCIEIRGELHLTLEAVAECYRVEVAWLREVHGFGLLGPGASAGDSTAIPARQLDRVARIVRLHFHHGLDLSGIAWALGEGEEPT
jgi:hypothetical protein